MQVTPIKYEQKSNFTLEPRELKPHEKNTVITVSLFASEHIKELKCLGVCEIYQSPNLEKTTHVIIDKNAQKLIQTFHRYGPKEIETQKFCPFGPYGMHKRYAHILGEENLATSTEDKSQIQREAILSYFTEDKLQQIANGCLALTENWIKEKIELKKVLLFDGCHDLITEILIAQVFGFSECMNEDIYCSTEYWKDLLAHKSSDLKLEPEKGFLQGIVKECLGLYEHGPYLVNKKHNYEMDSLDVNKLCEKIYEATFDKKTSLVYHLIEKSLTKNEILENIKGLLLAAAEPTGYLLGFLLYEYAKNPDIQAMHAENGDGIANAYLETLRLYSVRGSVREANADMVLKYFDDQGEGKEHYIRKGDLIRTSPMIAGHNPLEFENPETFDPYRENLEAAINIPHFGSGVHECIGKKVAEMLIINCVDEILSYASLTTDTTVTSVIGKYTIRPKTDILVNFSPR